MEIFLNDPFFLSTKTLSNQTPVHALHFFFLDEIGIRF